MYQELYQRCSVVRDLRENLRNELIQKKHTATEANRIAYELFRQEMDIIWDAMQKGFDEKTIQGLIRVACRWDSDIQGEVFLLERKEKHNF